ncbi:MAG: hypothetical protein IJU03_05380 [Thermoguttaceae bacterium]|nr:hypothetical protein [Thermoguttaceae bacterium]
MTRQYDNLSIRGRVAYLIMCFERYVAQKYPDRDMTLPAEFMWNVVDGSDYMDEQAYRYMDIIPDYLFETDKYETSDMVNMSKDEYNVFVTLLPRTEDDPDLNVVMHRIYDVAMRFVYTEVELDDPDTKEYLKEVDDILAKNGIEAPDIDKIPKSPPDECDGWGKFIDSKPLSIILKK